MITAVLLGLDATPSPIPEFTGDADAVTPGVLGFVAIFLIAVATVLLILDMTRRVRRVRYRAEIRERLDAEAAEAAGADSSGKDTRADGPTRAPGD